jgi:hypothetical protein
MSSPFETSPISFTRNGRGFECVQMTSTQMTSFVRSLAGPIRIAKTRNQEISRHEWQFTGIDCLSLIPIGPSNFCGLGRNLPTLH